jgi:hypothetical protein
MAALNLPLMLCAGPTYAIFCSDSCIMFLAQVLPHAVIGKLAWYANITWGRAQIARLSVGAGPSRPRPRARRPGPARPIACGPRRSSLDITYCAVGRGGSDVRCGRADR